MKKLIFLCFLCPFLTHSQPALWNEFNINTILPQFGLTGTNSVFHPNLSVQKRTDPKQTLLLCTGNRYTMKEMSYLDAGMIWHMEHGTMGYKAQFHGQGNLSSNSHHIHYTQELSHTLEGGISIGIINMKFKGESPDRRGSVQLKIRQSFGSKTSFGFGFGLAGNLIHKQERMIKQWSCRWDQVLNPALSIGVALEKIDKLEPRIRLFMQTQIHRSFTMAAGWNLDNGNVEMAGLHNHKKIVKGLLIRHHPLLGYGLELMLQYDIR